MEPQGKHKLQKQLLQSFVGYQNIVKKTLLDNPKCTEKKTFQELINLNIFLSISQSISYNYSTDDIQSQMINQREQHKRIMLTFKVESCSNPLNCECDRFHDNQGDHKRRKPQRDSQTHKWKYMPQFCAIQNCRNRQNCRFAHNTFQILYHPMKYKTTPCNKLEICVDLNCPFYHNDKEYRVPSQQIWVQEVIINQEQQNIEEEPENLMINNQIQQKRQTFSQQTFKTKECCIKTPHKREICLRFHDQFDRRRDPNIFHYQDQPCQFAYSQSKKTFQPEKCPMGNSCQFAHSLLQLQYHQNQFRTTECPDKLQCKIKNICPFKHEQPKLIQKVQQNEQFQRKFLFLKQELDQLIEKKNTLKIPTLFKCSICLSPQIKGAFQCGHLVCYQCFKFQFQFCPDCRPLSPFISFNK